MEQRFMYATEHFSEGGGNRSREPALLIAALSATDWKAFVLYPNSIILYFILTVLDVT
jgi:hypothetical protein